MASEQKLDVTGEFLYYHTHDIITQLSKDAPSNSGLPNCAPSETGHKGEPEAHPVSATLQEGVSKEENVTEGERIGCEELVPGTEGQEIGIEVQIDRAGNQEPEVLESNREEQEWKREEEITKDGKVICEDRPKQVTIVSEGECGQGVTGEETGSQGSGVIIGQQVVGGETAEQSLGGETGQQKTSEEMVLQILDGVINSKVSTDQSEEPGQQVTAEDRLPEVEEELTGQQEPNEVTSEETGQQVADEEIAPQVTGHIIDIQRETDPQETCTVEETATEVPENEAAPLTDAGEQWVKALVENIVAEVTSQGACTGEQVTSDGTGSQVEINRADAGVPLTEQETHSIVPGMERKIMTEEQVREGAGAAAEETEREVDAPAQVTHVSTGITVDGPGEEQGTQVGIERIAPEEGTGAGEDGELSCEEVSVDMKGAAGAQECVEGRIEVTGELETGGQVIASGEEAETKVTPDTVSDPGREGTPDQPLAAACREKEWPALICAGREVRADTVEQEEAQRGTATVEELCQGTPEMKDRELEQEGDTLTPETPIEREIRLTMEREMMLRQERGISVPVGQPEYVEVRRKTITVEPVPLAGKERQLAGAQMQREIQLETRREQDLVELGKVMGTYDRGHQKELQERKMIFESMNTEPSETPIKKNQNEWQQATFTVNTASQVPEAPSNAVPAAESRKGPSYAEANGSNVIIIDHSSILRRSVPGNVFPPAEPRRSVPNYYRGSAPEEYRRSTPADIQRFTPAETLQGNSTNSPPPNSVDSPTQAPGSPFQLLRSPSPRSLLEREIEEVQERERELRRQRSSVYGRNDTAEETAQTTQENRGDVQSSTYQPERPSWRRLDVNWPPNTGAVTNGQQQGQVHIFPYTRRQRSALIQSWESGNPNPLAEE